MIERVHHVETSRPADFTLSTLSRVAREAAREWTIRLWAGRLAARAGPHDYRQQLRNLLEDVVRTRWRYVMEPDEYVHGSPASLVGHVLGAYYNRGPTCPTPLECDVHATPWRARGWGDCDDVATLVAAGVMALGMRARWRIARSPRGAHLAVQAETPNGERIDLDPVAWPTLGRRGELAGFRWGVTGPDVDVEVRDLDEGGRGMLAGTFTANLVRHAMRPTRHGRVAPPARRAAPARRGRVDRGCHWVAVPAHDRLGPRVLAMPGHAAKNFGRGIVVDGTLAADQFGHHYQYDADRDLWVPERQDPLGRLSRAERRARRKARRLRRRRRVRRFFRKVGAAFKKVGKGLRRIGARVLSSPIVQRVIGGALRIVGVPAMLTRVLLKAIGGIMKEGGIVKLIRQARRDPKGVLRTIARIVGAGGRMDLVNKIRGFFSGPFRGEEPSILEQDGAVFYGAPVAAMIGFDGVIPAEAIVVSEEPEAGRWYRAQHTDKSFLELVGRAYDVPSGGARLERAKWVVESAANAAQLSAPKSDFEKKNFPGGTVKLNPAHACDTAAAVAGDDGKCYPLIWFPRARGDMPPAEPAANDDNGSGKQWPTPAEQPAEHGPLPPPVDDGEPGVVDVGEDDDDRPPAPPLEPSPAPEYDDADPPQGATLLHDEETLAWMVLKAKPLEVEASIIPPPANKRRADQPLADWLATVAYWAFYLQPTGPWVSAGHAPAPQKIPSLKSPWAAPWKRFRAYMEKGLKGGVPEPKNTGPIPLPPGPKPRPTPTPGPIGPGGIPPAPPAAGGMNKMWLLAAAAVLAAPLVFGGRRAS